MSISSSNKRIAKNTSYLYIRLFITLCISLYTSRAFLDALGVDDYGIYNVVAGFVSLLSIFTSTITSAAQRFIAFELGQGDMKSMKNTFSTFVSLMIIISIVIFILGEAIGLIFLDKILVIPAERLSMAYVVFHCSIISFVVNLIAIPYIACVIAHEHMNFFAIVSVLESILKLVIVWLLYISTYDKLGTYAVLFVIVGIIIRLIYSAYCKRHYDEVEEKLTLNKYILKKIFSYSVWVTVGASSAIFKEQGVNVIINMFFGVAMNAARGISVHVMGIINQFGSNIGQAITPQITKSYASGDVNRAINLTFLLTKAQGILLYAISLPLLLETEYVLGLWLKEVPDYAVILTRWALILCLARTLECTHGPLFLATGKVKKLQIIGGGIMLLNLPVSYIALSLGFPPESTMMVGVFFELVVMWVAFFYLKELVRFPVGTYYKRVVTPLFIMFLVAPILPFYIRCTLMEEGFLRLVVIGLLSVLFVIALSYMFVLSSKERQIVYDLIKSRIRKVL